MKALFKRSFRILFQLLRPQLPLFCTLLPIQSIQLFISYRFVEHVGIGLIMGTIAWAYILTIPQNIIRSRIVRGIYTAVILVICSLLGLIELFCAVRLGELVGIAHRAIIANTNFNESIEFLSTYLDIKFILIISGIAILAIIIYELMKRVKSIIIEVIITVISFCSLIITVNYGLWADCGIGRAIDVMMPLFKIRTYNLKESQPEFIIQEKSLLHPNIILIIGESFDKYHSSLYGYNKETNPLLSKRENDSTLVVFSSVQSPAPNTNLSLRQMLCLSEKYDDDSWDKKPMLPTALSKGGYTTRWLSNQCATSLFDCTFRELAHLCDSVLYTTEQYLDFKENNTNYDDVIFPPFKNYVAEVEQMDRNFCVLHLMGSHLRYDLRYPKDFAKFTKADYTAQPEERRETFASYDNSILYNDYVVDNLMKISDSLEAVVIYAPDHGQDFFYTRDIASHGALNDPVSFDAGCQIPFMIYFTTPFRKKHPDIVERTRSVSDREFNTNYLMNTIMDIAGYDIPESSIFKNSLFEGKFGDSVNN